MKKAHLLACISLAGACFLLAPATAGAREDGYDKMARELSGAASKLTTPKVAIIPFTYVDKRPSNAGVVISERLTTRMVKIGKCTVIERQLIENVLQELHFENTGLADVETTKKLGKVLGVDAIITGTLMDVDDETAEINARVIKAESAEVIATSSVEVKRTWTDTPIPQQAAAPAAAPTAPGTAQETAPQSQQQAPAYTAPAAAPVRTGPAIHIDTYLDVFLGSMMGGSMETTFQNNTYREKEDQLGFDFNGTGINNDVSYKKVVLKDASARSLSAPVGLRITGFGKHWGGDFEISYSAMALEKKTAKASFDNGSERSVTLSGTDYITVKSLALASGDVFYRFSDKMVQPYIGMGLGLTINSVESSFIKSYSDGVWQDSLSQYGIGFLFRVPIGVRVQIARDFQAFVEYRPMYNTVWFDREIKEESDTLVLSPSYFLFGIGMKL